ncbi:hypothetical protein T4D_16484 [Trichinella pseudospiralis]|uniref:Uncharacterized protein n=1 Tax=Trichinella pseudospiralis TaxID=6337 RepID=A0A0V1FMX1_TRIPS|nr:hypothetical protein T4D_16484 [Trichinella pseudospiralis]
MAVLVLAKVGQSDAVVVDDRCCFSRAQLTARSGQRTGRLFTTALLIGWPDLSDRPSTIHSHHQSGSIVLGFNLDFSIQYFILVPITIESDEDRNVDRYFIWIQPILEPDQLIRLADR